MKLTNLEFSEVLEQDDCASVKGGFSVDKDVDIIIDTDLDTDIDIDVDKDLDIDLDFNNDIDALQCQVVCLPVPQEHCITILGHSFCYTTTTLVCSNICQ